MEEQTQDQQDSSAGGIPQCILWLSIGPASQWKNSENPRRNLRLSLESLFREKSPPLVFVAAEGSFDWHSLVPSHLATTSVLFVGSADGEDLSLSSEQQSEFEVLATMAGRTSDDGGTSQDPSDDAKQAAATSRALSLTGSRRRYLDSLLDAAKTGQEPTFLDALIRACDTFEANALRDLSAMLSEEAFEAPPIMWLALDALRQTADGSSQLKAPGTDVHAAVTEETAKPSFQMELGDLLDAVGGVGDDGCPDPVVMASIRQLLDRGVLEMLPTKGPVKLTALPKDNELISDPDSLKGAFIQQENSDETTSSEKEEPPRFLVSAPPPVRAAFRQIFSGADRNLEMLMTSRVAYAHLGVDMLRLNQEAAVIANDLQAHLTTVDQIDGEVRSQLTDSELDVVDFEIIRSEKSIIQRCENISLRRRGLVAAAEHLKIKLKQLGINTSENENENSLAAVISAVGEEVRVREGVLEHMQMSHERQEVRGKNTSPGVSGWRWWSWFKK
jgi:hypothetical protein